MSDGTRHRPSKWIAILVGTIAGALLAAVAAGGLAVIVLIPQWSRFFGLGGEFDGLLLIGLPVFALPCGALGGLVFGCIWKRQRDWLIAVSCASLPAVAYFLIGAWQNVMYKNARDQFVSTTVCAICLVLASAISLKLLERTFVAIERHKTARLNAR